MILHLLYIFVKTIFKNYYPYYKQYLVTEKLIVNISKELNEPRLHFQENNYPLNNLQ